MESPQLNKEDNSILDIISEIDDPIRNRVSKGSKTTKNSMLGPTQMRSPFTFHQSTNTRRISPLRKLPMISIGTTASQAHGVLQA